jgi:hypothetical protein
MRWRSLAAASIGKKRLNFVSPRRPEGVNERFGLGVGRRRNCKIGISGEPRFGARGDRQATNQGERDMRFSEVAVDLAQSRYEGCHANRSKGLSGTLASWRCRTVQKPIAEQPLDLLVAGVGMTPAEILAHQIKSRLEQVDRRAERVGDGWGGSPFLVGRSRRTRKDNVRLSKGTGKHSRDSTPAST